MPYVELPLGGGLNLKARATDIGPDQLQKATGCRFDVRGAVSSDKGRRVLEALGSEIKGIADATLDGTKRIIAKAGANLYGDGTIIAGYGGGDSHMSLVVWNDYGYVADGNVFKRLSYDGSSPSLEAVGLSSPSAAPTASASGSGNLIDAGTYKYVFTYYNGVAESNFSPAGSVTITLGQRVNLSAITAGPTGTTERRIYRTTTDGAAYFYLATLSDNTTTVYTDTKKLPDEADSAADPSDDITLQAREITTVPVDSATWPINTVHKNSFGQYRNDEARMSNLGIIADWTDHDPPPAGMSHVTRIKGQIFGIADNKVYFSKVGQPEHWPIYNFIPAGRQAGETITALRPLGDAMIVYTDAGVHRIDLVGLSFEDSRLLRTDARVGLAAEWATADVTINGQPAHVYLARSGLYLFDGISAIEVSRDVEDLFVPGAVDDSINSGAIGMTVMAAYRDRLWMSYPSRSSTRNDRTLYADFENPQDVKISILPYGFSTLGIDEVGNVALGGDDDGNTYVLGEGTGGLWEPTTRDYEFGEATRLKRFEELVLDADLGGLSTTVTVTTNLDRQTSFTLDGSHGRTRYRRLLPATLKGHYASVGLSSTGAAERHWYRAGMNVTVAEEP